MRISIKDISLRVPRQKDWDFILELRNQFYKMFDKQSEPLLKKEHYVYMKKQQSNPKFHHWLICFQEDVVGYARILDTDIGIMIKKDFQQKGIATIALKLIEKKAKDLGIHKLVALVKVENISSDNLFKRSNYLLKMYRYEKIIF